jgi:hypothetical protein
MRPRLLAVLGAVVGLTLLAMLVGPARAEAGPGTSIGGIRFDYLPGGLGQASDFTYEYDDVTFTARVWESPDAGGGSRVDADLEVLSGARLANGSALHDWFVAYQARPPAEAHDVPVRVHSRPGWLARDQLFWLVRPGLAVSVTVDGTRWSTSEVMRIGWSARVGN